MLDSSFLCGLSKVFALLHLTSRSDCPEILNTENTVSASRDALERGRIFQVSLHQFDPPGQLTFELHNYRDVESALVTSILWLAYAAGQPHPGVQSLQSRVLSGRCFAPDRAFCYKFKPVARSC